MKLIFLPIICVAGAIIGAVALPYGLFWLTILPLIGFVALTVGSCIIAYFWYKRVPQAARILVEAYQRKKPPLYIAHDSGRGALTWIEEKGGEGIVITKDGRYKILPQFSAVSKKGNPDGDVKEVEYEKDYRDFISKRGVLTGMDLPFFLGYSGKLCLLNPEALALYEAGEMAIKDSEGKVHGVTRENHAEKETVCSKCGKILDEGWDHCPYCNGKKKVVQKVRKELPDLLQPLLLLDPRRIKELIGRQFNVSQIGALMVESEQIGLLGRGTFKKYLPIVFILTAVVIGGILLLMAPNLLSGFGGGA